MNDDMTYDGTGVSAPEVSFEKNSVDEPYTIVGERWSDAMGGEGTATGTVSDVDEGISSDPSTPLCSYFLTRLKTGECFQLVGSTFYVGKSKEASYQIRGTDTISRLHVCFHVVDGECWAEDNGSLNGTMVDGVKLTPHSRVRVGGGSRIRLSDEDFLIETKML